MKQPEHDVLKPMNRLAASRAAYMKNLNLSPGDSVQDSVLRLLSEMHDRIKKLEVR